jgi:hypothetical protein
MKLGCDRAAVLPGLLVRATGSHFYSTECRPAPVTLFPKSSLHKTAPSFLAQL